MCFRLRISYITSPHPLSWNVKSISKRKNLKKLFFHLEIFEKIIMHSKKATSQHKDKTASMREHYSKIRQTYKTQGTSITAPCSFRASLPSFSLNVPACRKAFDADEEIHTMYSHRKIADTRYPYVVSLLIPQPQPATSPFILRNPTHIFPLHHLTINPG